MFSDNPILSRTLAVLLLVAVVAGFWIVLIAPVLDQRASYKSSIDRDKRLIAAFEGRQENIDALKRELSALRSDQSRQAAYFTATSATLAAAKLQSRIKALTQAAGAGLTSTQVVTSEEKKGELQRVTVRAHMIGSIEAIRSIFHTLETGQPYIFIDNVTITANTARRTVRGRATSQSSAGTLTVRYEAYGFLWREEQS